MLIDQKAAREIADRGNKIYNEHIKHLVNFEEDKGKFVVIDVESGDYEIDRRDAAATRRLYERRPDAVSHAVRIGRPTAYRIVGVKLNRSR